MLKEAVGLGLQNAVEELVDALIGRHVKEFPGNNDKNKDCLEALSKLVVLSKKFKVRQRNLGLICQI